MINSILKLFFGLKENKDRKLEGVTKFLIVRQHNQFGDMLANVSLFRAIKETYPEAEITLIVSPQNHYAVTKNKFIDECFNFDKKKLFSLKYIKSLRSVLKKKYDVAIIPSTVSISATSLILGRIANAEVRIGPSELNGKVNKYSYFLDRRIPLDWRKYPDAHVSDFGLDIVRPFGITTKDFSSTISFDDQDIKVADNFIKENFPDSEIPLVGLHVGAGKPHNRWALDNFIEVMDGLNESFGCRFILTGSSSDKNELDYVMEHTTHKPALFINRTIPQLAALISMLRLFVTNDTGVMHVAGTTKTPQISVFGPTNPFNWAPVGPNKFFIRKSDLLDDITTEDVLKLAKMILGNTER